MKKVLLLSILICSLFTVVNGQNAKVDAQGNYTAITRVKTNQEAKQTGKTFTDSKGIVYPVLESKNGKLYYVKVSAKTGNSYNVYLKL